jgi:uncharacterized repeat protein (TIGR01451 family)
MIVLNMSANLLQAADIGVTLQALPASMTAGSDATFFLTVRGTGSVAPPTTVTDTIPAGLSIQSASAGDDTCSVAGQHVSCTLPSLPATIAIVVSAGSPGSYTNTALATGTLTDPHPANNSASAALTVTAPAAPVCHLVSLKAVPLSEAKKLIRTLGCAVGKVTKKSSKTVPKGDVISNSPRSGTAALGKKILIVSSSGKPKPKKHK